MKYFSMFSGIGGFEYGIEQAYNNQSAHLSKESQSQKCEQRREWDSKEPRALLCSGEEFPLCVGFSEIDKYAIQTYLKHFPNHKNYGDATKINTDELPDFDFLCGGFPCQSFSIAGKRGGFKDTRGTLFFEICRVLKAKRPSYFLLENVKGLLNHDKGETFRVILQSLSELGYDVQWMVLNSKFFGVPQNRERVFIIGNLGGKSRLEILPFREIKGEDNASSELCDRPELLQGNKPEELSEEKEKADCFIADFRNDEGLRIRKNKQSPSLTSHGDSLGGIPVPMVISPCLASRKHSETDISTMPPMVIQESKIIIEGNIYPSGGQAENIINSKGISPSLTRAKIVTAQALQTDGFLRQGTSFGTDNPQSSRNIRRLTPKECARLQGFPDDWAIGSNTHKYKQYGNAVTTNVIEQIIRRML